MDVKELLQFSQELLIISAKLTELGIHGCRYSNDERPSAFYRTRKAAERAIPRLQAHADKRDAERSSDLDWDDYCDYDDGYPSPAEEEAMRQFCMKEVQAMMSEGNTQYVWQLPLKYSIDQRPFLLSTALGTFYAVAMHDGMIRVDYKMNADGTALTDTFVEPKFLKRFGTFYVEPKNQSDWHAEKFPKNGEFTRLPEEWNMALENKVLYLHPVEEEVAALDERFALKA